MQYRKFGKLDWRAPALGFGCMRLPTTDNVLHSPNIDEEQATSMLYHAIDNGVTYLDTGYTYHGGNSELLLGRALKGSYRDKVKLATKLPCWLVSATADFDKYLNEQLKKLQVEHIDFYLLHGLNHVRWPAMHRLGMLERAERAMADGRIGHLGFSFHDDLEVFKSIIDAYDGWSFCQVQYNYMDVEYQAGIQGLKYAAAQGLAVVVMEPLRGGMLANPPPDIQALWDTAATRRAAYDWALQWLWNQPEVSLVLSGMSTLDQVRDNLASASISSTNVLSAGDMALFSEVRARYSELRPIPCTQCGYCLPCPNGVNIPRNFLIYNDGAMYHNAASARNWYNVWLREDERASACLACDECEEKCPQHIPISAWMPIVHGVLGEGQPLEAVVAPPMHGTDG